MLNVLVHAMALHCLLRVLQFQCKNISKYQLLPGGLLAVAIRWPAGCCHQVVCWLLPPGGLMAAATMRLADCFHQVACWLLPPGGLLVAC